MKTRAGVVALAAAFYLCLAPGSFAKHSKQQPAANTNVPGEFDYYLLTLSWAPQFCATNPSGGGTAECSPKKHMGLVVHGLWPQHNDGRWPQNCSTSPPVRSDTVNHMLPIMPGKGLIQHEWSKHGTSSGLSADDYFAAIEKVFGRLTVPEQFKRPTVTAETNPRDIESTFATANNAPNAAFRVSCLQNQFSALEICLTKDFQYKACPKSLKECKAPELQVRPVK
ncbi:MAG TPA: ribonuclease T2 [Terriglobales bacterium]|nr:ribonuclease T2 [Terriglobales bacterium]